MPEYAKSPMNWAIIGVLAFVGIKGINWALTKVGAPEYKV